MPRTPRHTAEPRTPRRTTDAEGGTLYGRRRGRHAVRQTPRTPRRTSPRPGRASLRPPPAPASAPAPAGERQIPKGLQESTLEKVRACLRQAPPQGLPSEAPSRATGLSAVTVRRYVNYLVERGEAVSTVNYDTGGRPCRLYRAAGGAE